MSAVKRYIKIKSKWSPSLTHYAVTKVILLKTKPFLNAHLRY